MQTCCVIRRISRRQGPFSDAPLCWIGREDEVDALRVFRRDDLLLDGPRLPASERAHPCREHRAVRMVAEGCFDLGDLSSLASTLQGASVTRSGRGRVEGGAVPLLAQRANADGAYCHFGAILAFMLPVLHDAEN